MRRTEGEEERIALKKPEKSETGRKKGGMGDLLCSLSIYTSPNASQKKFHSLTNRNNTAENGIDNRLIPVLATVLSLICSVYLFSLCRCRYRHCVICLMWRFVFLVPRPPSQPTTRLRDEKKKGGEGAMRMYIVSFDPICPP